MKKWLIQSQQKSILLSYNEFWREQIIEILSKCNFSEKSHYGNRNLSYGKRVTNFINVYL